MLEFMFQFGSIIFVMVWILSKNKLIQLKNMGYFRTRKRGFQEVVYGRLGTLVMCMIPVINIIMLLIAIFATPEKLYKGAINRGEYIKIDKA